MVRGTARSGLSFNAAQVSPIAVRYQLRALRRGIVDHTLQNHRSRADQTPFLSRNEAQPPSRKADVQTKLIPTAASSAAGITSIWRTRPTDADGT